MTYSAKRKLNFNGLPHKKIQVIDISNNYIIVYKIYNLNLRFYKHVEGLAKNRNFYEIFFLYFTISVIVFIKLNRFCFSLDLLCYGYLYLNYNSDITQKPPHKFFQCGSVFIV